MQIYAHKNMTRLMRKGCAQHFGFAFVCAVLWQTKWVGILFEEMSRQGNVQSEVEKGVR